MIYFSRAMILTTKARRTRIKYREAEKEAITVEWRNVDNSIVITSSCFFVIFVVHFDCSGVLCSEVKGIIKSKVLDV